MKATTVLSSTILRRLRLVVNGFGFEVQNQKKTRPEDYSEWDRAVVYAYLDNEKNSVLVKIAPEECRTSMGMAFSAQVPGHVPAILKDTFTHQRSEAFLADSLSQTLQRWIGKSAAELCGVAPDKIPALQRLPASAHVLPWFRRRLDIREAERHRDWLMHGKRYGVAIPEPDPADNYQSYCRAVGLLKARQYMSIHRAIQEYGYLRNDTVDGDICADILWSGTGERFLVRSGNHRLNVMAALDHVHVPVRVCRLIRRDEAEMWPQVQRGVMSVETSLEIFDGIFDGPFAMSAEASSHTRNREENARQ